MLLILIILITLQRNNGRKISFDVMRGEQQQKAITAINVILPCAQFVGALFEI
jgi:uncharacterized membrane protein YciS (DUF1049 family)